MISPTRIVSSLRPRSNPRRALDLQHAQRFVGDVFGEDLHAARVVSLANGVAGVLNSASMAIHAIGRAYAAVAHITPKSATKQIDRMLSNQALPLDALQSRWAAFVVSAREEIVVALDWTDFDDDDHTTLCAYVVTRHGRATPLAWKTVKKSELTGERTATEFALIEQIHGWLPPAVGVTLLADRAFGNQELYALLEAYGWDYVIRFRGCIRVEASDGEARTAEEWLEPSGRAKMLRGVRVTHDRAEIPAVVVTKGARMKDAWYLATSLKATTASEVVKLYGKRFTIEETFRDTKDLHFGMGLSATHIRNAARRDRLLLLVAVAHTLLTLLGAASEESGLDRKLKVNTVKHRTHSLFRQGAYWYGCIATMREEWLRPLMIAFDRIVREHATGREMLGWI